MNPTPSPGPLLPVAPAVRLRALGGLSLECNGQSVDGPAAQPRRLALLALLAASPEGGASRDRVIALLWPEVGADRGRHRLGQLLHLLRLDPLTVDAVQGAGQLRLDPGHLSSDVSDFTRAVAGKNWDAVVGQYHGPFLEGFHLGDSVEFEDWIDATRTELGRHYREALEILARRAANQGDGTAAARYWRRLASDDPLDGRVALEVMKTLDAAEDSSGALTQGEVHSRSVERELGIAPADISRSTWPSGCPLSLVSPLAELMARPSTHPVLHDWAGLGLVAEQRKGRYHRPILLPLPTRLVQLGIQMNAPTHRISATLTHAIAIFGPYDPYILLISLTSLTVLAIDSLLTLTPEAYGVLGFADEAFCALFLLDFLRSLYRAPNRVAYFLKGGWLDLLSAIPTVDAFRIGRLSRIARVVRLMRAMRSFRAIGLIVSRKRQESAMLAAGVVCLLMTVFASLAILQFEQAEESNIRTAGDAVWWAFATVTTVGYGDHILSRSKADSSRRC